MEEGYNVEVSFKGSNGDQAKKGAILVRVDDPSCHECGAVELLVKLTWRLRKKEYRSDI